MVGFKNTFGKALRLTALAASLGSVAACDHVRQHSVSQKHGDFTVLEGDAADHLVFVGRRDETVPVVCAMPSPDGISAHSTSGSLSGGTPKASGAAAFSNSRAAAFVGMRTQTVQLLRDGYYRLCEAYMNKAISREQYNLALTNMPGVFATLMAIDTVAGAAVAPAVALSASAGSTNVDNSNSASSANGEGQEGATSTERGSESKAGTGAVSGEASFSDIQKASTISKEGAQVLISALHATKGGTNFMPAFCASVLVDSESPGANAPINATTPRGAFHKLCKDLLHDMQGVTTNNLNQKNEAVAKALQAEKAAKASAAKASAAKVKADAENKNLKEKVAALSKKVAANDKTRAEFSEGLAKDAVKGVSSPTSL